MVLNTGPVTFNSTAYEPHKREDLGQRGLLRVRELEKGAFYRYDERLN
jgi:hypothetical protein